MAQLTLNAQTRTSCVATLSTIYGIGNIKAQRINSFLLNSSKQLTFNKELSRIFSEYPGANILNIPIDVKIRINKAKNLLKMYSLITYKSLRMFQGLPARGQRTHGNSGTPSRIMPFKLLNIQHKNFSKLEILYKRKEFMLNGRFEQLQAYNRSLEENIAQSKEEEKNSRKKKRESFMKTQKNKYKKK
jgi:ribosomal protein S13